MVAKRVGMGTMAGTPAGIEMRSRAALPQLLALFDLVDDTEICRGVEDVAQPVADDRVVVGEEDSGDEGDAHPSSVLGTCRRTSVPRPLARPIEMLAPTSSARSRMPRRPLDVRSA
jgi:hypothetical protein